MMEITCGFCDEMLRHAVEDRAVVSELVDVAAVLTVDAHRIIE